MQLDSGVANLVCDTNTTKTSAQPIYMYIFMYVYVLAHTASTCFS